MNEHNQLKAFVAFLFIFSVMAVSQTFAASFAVPTVPGYSSGRFTSPAGGFTMSPANDAYLKPSVVNVGGKAITVPATLRMAANAGQFAKDAMRLNPWAIAGTLAAGYLLDQLLQWNEGTQSWESVPSIYPGGTVSQSNACLNMSPGQYARDSALNRIVHMPHPPLPTSAPCVAPYSPFASCSQAAEPYYQPGNMPYTVCMNPTSANQPFPNQPYPDSSWPALPDPLPDVAPELPYAPYMPEGAPVDAPSFDFAPMDVPVGEPYTKPDGSTHQPMAKVSPNGTGVTIDTYDMPLTDTAGQPVPNPTPSDTTEPPPNHCEQNPNTIGCSEYGNAGAVETIPTTTIAAPVNVAPVGTGGVCPADVVTTRFGITWSYQPICDFASAVRPFVLGFAWLSFAFVVAGAVRT